MSSSNSCSSEERNGECDACGELLDNIDTEAIQCIACPYIVCIESCAGTEHECQECWLKSDKRADLVKQLGTEQGVNPKIHSSLEKFIYPGHFPEGWRFKSETVRKQHQDKFRK